MTDTTMPANPIVRVGMSTPWGTADYAKVLVPGIGWVSTPGHGGLKLDRAHNAQVPDYMRREGGWYEEDCDWAIAYIVFEVEIKQSTDEYALKAIQNGEHWRTFRNWHPYEYERFAGKILAPGESHRKDDIEATKAATGKLCARWARNDTFKGIPKGFVGVQAMTCTGLDATGWPAYAGPTRWFLIPAKEYDSKTPGMIIDPAKCKEVQPGAWED